MDALRLLEINSYYDETSDSFIVEDEDNTADKTLIQAEKREANGIDLILYEVGNGWTWELSNS